MLLLYRILQYSIRYTVIPLFCECKFWLYNCKMSSIMGLLLEHNGLNFRAMPKSIIGKKKSIIRLALTGMPLQESDFPCSCGQYCLPTGIPIFGSYCTMLLQELCKTL